MTGSRKSLGKKHSRLFGAGPGMLLLDEQPVTLSDEAEVSAAPVAAPVAAPAPAKIAPPAAPPAPAKVAAPVAAPTPAKVAFPTPLEERLFGAEPELVHEVKPPAPASPPRVAAPVAVAAPAPVPATPRTLPPVRREEEVVEDEPTAPSQAPAHRQAPRVENLVGRTSPRPDPATRRTPSLSGREGPATPVHSTGFSLLPSEEEAPGDRTAPMPRPIRPSRASPDQDGPSLARAARMWAEDEELFEEATPPAPPPPPRRPELATAGRRPTPVPVERAVPAAGEPPARSRPVEGDRAPPLRVFLGASGADGSAPRAAPPTDGGEPIWDAAAIAQRSLEAERAPLPGRAGELPDDDDPTDGRSTGELPRTWMNPARLPPALERPHGNRPRRVGGVVQPVPGTPSAIAIAREEAESARFGPPPPLPSTMPLLIGRGWAAPEEASDGPVADAGASGFQLVHEIPQSASAREAVAPGPMTPRTERPAPSAPPGVKAAARPGTVGTYVLWGGLGVVLAAALLGALFFSPLGAPIRARMRERRAVPAEVERVPEPAPVVAPEPEAAPVVAPEPTPVPAPVAEPVVLSAPVVVEVAPHAPCEASADEPATGLLSIRSNLPGTLIVGGRNCGTVPVSPLRLKPGIYRVQIRAKTGRLSPQQTVRVDAERAAEVNVQF